jgi:hypothetical protein
LPWPRLPGPSALMSLLTEPALTAPVPPAPAPAAATPPRVVLVLLEPLVPAWVLLVVAVFCVALVLWLVVALGLMVTLLCGMARKVASVFTDVLALGATDWVAAVLVVLLALFVVLPLLPEAAVDPVPAWVLLVVAVFWVADVVWLVVPLGLIVTVLCGIARKVVLVSTDVLALGATDWVDWVLVLLVAVLLVCARAEPPVAAKTTAAMRVSLFLIIGFSVSRCPMFRGRAPRAVSVAWESFRRCVPTAGQPHQTTSKLGAVLCPATAGIRDKKGFAAISIAANPLSTWCRREESNPRPSHYE